MGHVGKTVTQNVVSGSEITDGTVTGADLASDIAINTTSNIGVGTTNPAHNLEIKTTAPEIMLEETSSGGSKRLSMGVTTGGLPFINAEQSGGQIAINLTGTEVARFTSAGLKIPSGSSYGIDFSATNDGGSNIHEILFDYEQGDWTPVFLNATGATVQVQSAKYTKIGSLVYAGSYVTCSGIPNSTDGFQIDGLPFPVTGSSNYHGGGAVTYTGAFNWLGLNPLSAPTPYSGLNDIYFHKSATATTIQYYEIQSLPAFIFSTIYITDY